MKYDKKYEESIKAFINQLISLKYLGICIPKSLIRNGLVTVSIQKGHMSLIFDLTINRGHLLAMHNLHTKF